MARPSGSRNIVTKEIREQIQWAFNNVNKGGAFLLDLAANDKALFVQLVMKTIPNDVKVQVEHTVDLGEAMAIAAERLIEKNNQPALLDVTPDQPLVITEAEQSVSPAEVKSGKGGGD